jgi:hypothetical protein
MQELIWVLPQASSIVLPEKLCGKDVYQMDDEKQEVLTNASQYLFPDFAPAPARAVPKKLRIDPIKLEKIGVSPAQAQRHDVEVLSQPILPTRWEYLQPKIEYSNVPLTTIIHPIDQAIEVIRSIIELLLATGGCQVFVIRADTGSGKTTFLNTLPHYMHAAPWLACQRRAIDQKRA